MTKLTQEQIETLEYSFANLNLNLESSSDLLTISMEGIQKQLDSGADKIFYSHRNETGGVTIASMKVGEETKELKKI